jgi:cytidine deaminase
MVYPHHHPLSAYNRRGDFFPPFAGVPMSTPNHPVNDLVRFVAKSILYGMSAGASFYALTRLDAVHYHFTKADDDPRSDGVESRLLGPAVSLLRSKSAAWWDRALSAAMDKLPAIAWMSLFACLLDESSGRALGPPQRMLVASLVLQAFVPSSKNAGTTSTDGSADASKTARTTNDDHRVRDPTTTTCSRGPLTALLPPSHQAPTPPRAAKASRYVELLVHNVSHTDLILSLESEEQQNLSSDREDAESAMAQSFVQVSPSSLESPRLPPPPPIPTRRSPTTGGDDPFCLARPRFSCFEKYSRVVSDHLAGDRDEILYFERYSRNEQSHTLFPDASLEETATGLRLSDASRAPTVDLNEVRVRGRDLDKAQGGGGGASCRIRHVLFPLLATLLPRWKERIQQKQYDRAASVKRVLILVSGVGTPRNWTHDRRGNSTETCARVMKAFLQRIDPALTVVHIHSETNIFRYDENLVFSEKELMPIIHSYRDAHARGLHYPDETRSGRNDGTNVGDDEQDVSLRTHPFSADWKDSFHTTLSFADGSPARTYAIQASLRQYRPTYFHFWQLKTFWHEDKIVNDDIEVHSFEAMETIPPVDSSSCSDPMVAQVIREMKTFKEEMAQTLMADNDIRRFWLRKTHKPVIAVLLVRSDGSEEDPVLYRGTNMEVSMPTGSLCAERNVIGTALADRPGLKREDLKLIAVLAVPLVDIGHRRGPSPELSGMRRVHSCNANIDCDVTPRSVRKASYGSEEDPEWILPFPKPDSRTSQYPNAEISSSTPRRTISLVSRSYQANAAGSKRTVVLQSSYQDLNPLRPCGACNEWLKKIAECNPYFKILTFTDAECNGVYITPCQD